VPCERIPLEHDWPGWWAKCELFKLVGPVLYFDLDTAIVGDLSDIASYAFRSSQLTMLQDFYAADHCGSGVMAWHGLNVRPLYLEMRDRADELMKKQRQRMGDQTYIEETIGRPFILRWQSAVPNQIVSYKVHCRNGIPPDARVVCLHGFPKFGDMPVNDPVRLAWESNDDLEETDRRAANCIYNNPDCTRCNA